MSHKKFDVDAFVDSLQLDEEIAEFEATNKQRDRKAKYRNCPRCGSRKWSRLYTDDYGRTLSCDICKDDYQ